MKEIVMSRHQIYFRYFTLFASLIMPAFHAIAEDVENPTYTNWAKFAIGTTVTNKAVTMQNGARVETFTTTILVSKTEKELVVSSQISSDGTGKKIQNDVNLMKVNRLFPLLPGVDKTRIGRPQGAKEQGFETIEVLGKKYQAEWYLTEASTEAGPSFTKTWISMEMPGQVLKSVTEVKAAQKKVNLDVIELKLGESK